MIEAAFLAGLNHLLHGANWARARLAPFAGRRACLVMPPLRLGFVVGADGYCLPAGGDAAPDVTVHLPADTPLRLLHGLDRIMAGARVEGNAEFATELSFVFRNLRWDAEEDLSKLVGDIAAHRLVQGAGRCAAWQKQAAGHLAENLADCLVREGGPLVAAAEFASFREEISRLEGSIRKLENRYKIAA